jgi:regulator of protease activity HflC (stomatin/prohibitin superfamily)
MVFFGVTVACFVGMFLLSKTLIVVSERHTVVKESFGKFKGALRPGLHLMIPFVDRQAYTLEMREQPIDVPPQMCITKDNIQVEVDGIVYLQVMDPYAAAYNVGDYRISAIGLAQTTMRSEIGKLTLEQTFAEREEINTSIVNEIDKDSAKWGIKVRRYEIKNLSPSATIIHTLEKQMEAERQKRAAVTKSQGAKDAKIMTSEGEMTSAINLSEGEKAKRINDANGQAAEIRLLADATAKSVTLVAEAIQSPGGNAAVKAQLAEQYINELGRILHGADVSVVPQGLAQMRGFFEGMNQVASATATATPGKSGGGAT